ncbi:hypothetical protein Tco_1509692 [Tanacetum coccineum]
MELHVVSMELITLLDLFCSFSPLKIDFCGLGSGLEWLFDIDTLTKSMNYKPVVAGNQSNGNACSKDSPDVGFKPSGEEEKKDAEDSENKDSEVPSIEEHELNTIYLDVLDDPHMPILEEINSQGIIPVNKSLELYIQALNQKVDKGCTDHGNVLASVHLRRNKPQKISNFDYLLVFYHKVEPKRNYNYSAKKAHPSAHRNMVPRAVLMKTGLRSLNTARHVNTAHPKTTIYSARPMSRFSKLAQSTVKRPYQKRTSLTNKNFSQKVNTAKGKFYTARLKAVNTARSNLAVFNVVRANQGTCPISQTSRNLIEDMLPLGEEPKEGKLLMSSMGELTFLLGLQVTQKDDGIFISQDKYVDEILKKFGFSTVKTASTPMETSKPLMKDENAEDVDVHLYRLMIGSLMYLTSSRPDIMFVVCACARFQVTPKVSYLHVVKRIFRYLKGQLKLGLWYPKDSPFDLEAYSDSDYAGASLDRKSTTGGCQFLGNRLISWQCKKQTIVANSTTEAEYVAAASCYRQVLWIQNQMLYYGYNFMNTKISINNESTICIHKNPVFHSKTKHIKIKHHFIRDSHEKRLIQVIKIHTDHNVADLLTKALDVSPDLIFADCHNMVAYLEKSEDNADFTEIVDFLNASPIRYALTVSPTVYVSYIEQFWSTAKIKTVNNETQIRTKVDGKTIVITESSVRRDLHFNDEDAVFNDEYDTPHTKKVFANIRRQGKDFSRTVTPLFATMSIQSQAVEGEGSGQPTESQHIPTTASPSHVEPIPIVASSSQPKKTQKHRKTKRKATEISQSSGPTTLVADETVHKERETGIGSGGSPRCQDTMGDRPTQTRVLDLENVKDAQALEIKKLKKRVKKLKSKKKSRTSQLKRMLFKFQEDSETQGRYGHDIGVNTTSTSITTASINITTIEPVTTANAPVSTASVSVSTAEPSTPPTTTTTTTHIEYEDLTIA